MASFASFRQTIAARLLLVAGMVAAPLVGLQFYNAFDTAEDARQEALAQATLNAKKVLERIELQARDIDSLLHLIAVTVPLRRNAIEQGNATLRRIKSDLPDYISSISVIEPDGTMLYSAETAPSTYRSINVADRGYFKDAVNDRGLAVSTPIVSRTSGKWVIIFARAIHEDEHGPLQGVVSMSVLLERFQESFTDAALPYGSLISVVDRNGIVLARSIEPREWIGRNLSSLQEVQDALRERDGAKERVTADGVTRLSAIASSDRMPWLVLAGIPSDVALAPSREQLHRAIMLTVVIATLAIALAAWLSRLIMAPLRRLSLDAAKLAGGELGHRSAVAGKGEIGELASSFNVMARQLERRDASLRATFEQAAVGIARVDRDGRLLEGNRRLCDMLDLDRPALLARSMRDLVCPEDADSDREFAQRLLGGDIPTYSVEKRLMRDNGDCIWANLTASLVRSGDGEPDYLLFVIENIDERKKSEALVAGQKQVLEMIARGADLHDTLAALLQVIEAQSPGMLCSILLLDDDGMHLRHGAAPSLPDDYRQAIDGGQIGERAGSCGTAAFRKEAVYVEDIACDPLWVDYRAVALRHELHACWSTPIFDAKGRLLGTFAIYYRTPGLPQRKQMELIDVATQTAAIAITRILSEKALRAERALLEQVMSCSPIGIFAMRMDGSFSLVNQAALDIVGEKRETIMQRAPNSPDWKIGDVHGKPLQPEQFPFARVKTSGKPVFDAEHSMMRPDGRRVLLSVNAAPQLDENGRMKGVVFAMQDITERRRVLETLRASEEKFAIAFRSSPDAIAITSVEDGRFLDINEAGVRLVGYSREELLSRPIIDLHFYEDPADRDRYVEEMTAKGGVTGTETIIRNRSGERRILQVAGELIELEGKPHMLSVARDITEQKRAEAEILKLNAELEQRVIERTAQLESANKELEAFSYSVSHDLKAPLRGIDGYSQLLEETSASRLDEEGMLFLRNIRSGVAQMHALIADLLAYARMERRSLDNTVLDLQACMNAVVQSCLHDTEGAGAVLRCNVPPLAVRGDRDGLSIVLRNLVDNAIKFSRNATPPTIDIDAREENDRVILSVRDNGIGFDMKFHERIFDIFSRLQRPEDYSGTGVGLALVRKAVQRMGGKVWAESAPGKGATFFLELTHG